MVRNECPKCKCEMSTESFCSVCGWRADRKAKEAIEVEPGPPGQTLTMTHLRPCSCGYCDKELDSIIRLHVEGVGPDFCSLLCFHRYVAQQETLKVVEALKARIERIERFPCWEPKVEEPISPMLLDSWKAICKKLDNVNGATPTTVATGLLAEGLWAMSQMMQIVMKTLMPKSTMGTSDSTSTSLITKWG